MKPNKKPVPVGSVNIHAIYEAQTGHPMPKQKVYRVQTLSRKYTDADELPRNMAKS